MEAEGEITTAMGNQVIRTSDGRFLIRRAHCECGMVAIPVIEKKTLVGYACHEHGFLDHDEIIYVRHPA